MITIDVSEIKDERFNLFEFLKSKIKASIAIKRKELIIEFGEDDLSHRNLKTIVKRFLHHKGLSEDHRVTEENNIISISKRKHIESRKIEKKGRASSPYDTLPYYFPNRP